MGRSGFACIVQKLGGGGADRRTRGSCDGSGELSGRSHKRKYAKISSLRYSYKVTENGCSSN